MGDGLVERLEAFEGVGPTLGRLLQVLEEPPVGGPPGFGVPFPEPAAEVLADQGVGVEGAALAGDDQAARGEAGDGEVPRGVAEAGDRVGEPGDRGRAPEDGEEVGGGRAVEEAEEAEDGELPAAFRAARRRAGFGRPIAFSSRLSSGTSHLS